MWDWPNNNWVAARERSAEGRWRCYMWAAEGAFGVSRDANYNTFAADLIINDAMTTGSSYIPAMYTLLKDSPELRLRFADRAQKQLFDGGALTTASMTEIFTDLRDQINPIMRATTGNSMNEGFFNTWIASPTRRN